jgi:hypothetical protein
MQAAIDSAPVSAHKVSAAHIVGALAVLFLLFDSAVKLLMLPAGVEATTNLGYPASVVFALGLVELACIIGYLVPRTSVLGAILLTGYLGGAIATHVRVGSPPFTHVLFPLYVAGAVWGSLYLRDPRVRALIAPRRDLAA